MSDRTEAADGLPSSIGRYRIDGTLGFGAMGAVYRAFDPIIKRTLAIKTIRVDVPPHSPQHKAFKDRFYQEARISGTLSHPGIVTLFDIGEEKEVPFLAMEYVEGQTIAAMIDSGERFKPERVLGLVSQVAAALDYAHSRGIIHRDIKPSNLIVQDGDRVKVTDFGIAKAVDSEITQSGALLGTPSYMSPEQAMGEKLDGRSDLFSLGVVAFEMLSGLQPFPGSNVTSILYRLVHVDPIEPADLEMNGLVPHKWREVFHKVLAKKPDNRYGKASEFVRDLEYCLGSWFSGLGDETVAIDSSSSAGAEPSAAPGAAPASMAPEVGAADVGAESSETMGLPAPGEGGDEEDPATQCIEAPTAGPSAEETVLVSTSGPSGALEMAPLVTTPRFDATEPVGVTAPQRAARPLPVGWLVGGAALLFLLAASTVVWLLWHRLAPPDVPDDTSAVEAGVAPTSAPEPIIGALRIASEPAGGSVTVDGAGRGQTPLEVSGIPFGTHQVRVDLPGHEAETREVTLAADQPTAELAVTLSPRAPTRGTVDFSSTPAGATVTVGGRRMGNTPLRGVALDPGRHRVQMALDGHQPWAGSVEVVAGKRARAEASLALAPQTRAAPTPTPAPPPVDTARIYENNAKSVDRVARKISGMSPRYPSDRAPRLREGDRVSVTLSFLVTETGMVEDLQVVESAGKLIDGVVVEAVESWRYRPAVVRDTPVKVRIVFKQTFLGG